MCGLTVINLTLNNNHVIKHSNPVVFQRAFLISLQVANNTLNFVYASQTNVTKDADHVYMDLTESGSNMYITKIAITKYVRKYRV